MYKSKHWTVNEWDCLQRSENTFAWTEGGRLCTDDERTFLPSSDTISV